MLYLMLGLCVFAGVLFAGIAAWLTTQRGNTIQDILNSKNANAESLKIEIADKFKLATNVPIVALYVVALVVAIGPIVYWIRMQARGYETYRVMGKVEDPPPSLYAMVRPPTLSFDKDGSFTADIPVKLDAEGRPDLPSMTFMSTDDYEQPVVHLQKDGAPVYVQHFSGHDITIETPIRLPRRAH